MLMEAINTLEACRTYNNAAVFFEEVCQPSRSAKAKRLTEAYVRLEFGKRAMLRCAPQHWRRIQRISSARTALLKKSDRWPTVCLPALEQAPVQGHGSRRRS